MATRKKPRHTVVGVFETRARAERALTELQAAGFKDDDIGMVFRDVEGKTVKTGAAADTYAEEGAGIGVVAGAAGGALIGAGIVAGVIPVIGPVLALGTLACARCDAPVAPTERSMSPADPLECPYCAHRGTVRDFLSLAPPTRPARVVVRVSRRASARLHR